MNTITENSGCSSRASSGIRCHRRWLACILALLTALWAAPSATAQSFPQTFIADSDGCNWPYSAVASNSANEIFTFCRTAANTYNLLKWNGSAWVTLSSFVTGTVKPNYISLDDVWLAIDSANAFHVVFSMMENTACCSQRRGVFYGKSTTGTSWTFTEIETFSDPNGWVNTDEAAVRVDSNNNPHVAFLKSDVNGGRAWTLRYWQFNGSTWSGSNAFSQGGVVNNEITAMNFDLDGNNKAHFVFQRETDGSGLDGGLWYINNTSGSFPGTATELIHGAQGAVTGGVPQINIDAANKVHIISRGPSTAIQYTTDASGSFVSTQVNGTLAGGLIRHSFSMNANGDKLIVHKPTAAPFIIKYAYQKAGESCWNLGDAFPLGTFTSVGGPPYSATITNNRRVMLLTDAITGSCSAANPRKLYSATSDFSSVSCGGGGPVAPTVTTTTQSAVTHNSATLGGNVTADGGASVTERGIVWSTNANPTTADTKVANGSGTGTFSGTVNGLPSNTPIHVRAYATNSVNTSYGSDISFTTLQAPVAVSSLTTAASSPTNAASVSWTLTFASAVTGVTASNFSLTNGVATGSTVGTPTTGNNITWTIPVTTGGTDGTITLNLANASGLSPAISSSLPYAGNSVTIDKTPPTVVSVTRLSPGGQNTNATTVTFRVTYSEPVTLNGTLTTHYQVMPVNGSTITGNVQSVTGSGATRDVQVQITGGTGEFRLRVLD